MLVVFHDPCSVSFPSPQIRPTAATMPSTRANEAHLCARRAPPVAWTSNGLPPPESLFDFWLLAVDVLLEAELLMAKDGGGDGGWAALVTGGGVAAELGGGGDACVEVAAAELVSAMIPPDDVELAAACVEVACAELASAVLVSGSAVELCPMVVTSMPLHSAGTPWPCRKTSMMELAGTLTLEQLSSTARDIWMRPLMHALEQRDWAEKSLATQPGMPST